MRLTATSTAALFLLFGPIGPSSAQRGGHDERPGKPERRVETPDRGGPPPTQQQHQRPGQAQSRAVQRQREPQGQRGQSAERQQQQRDQRGELKPQPGRSHQQAIAWQRQRGWLQHGGWQGRGSWRQNRAERWEREHRTWAQRGGYGGYYIPRERFALYFGNQHWFRLRVLPAIYMGYPRFEYGGFSFLLVDPWPEYWAETWYATDDVYIDYDDGYYLYNRRHPGVRLAITVAL